MAPPSKCPGPRRSCPPSRPPEGFTRPAWFRYTWDIYSPPNPPKANCTTPPEQVKRLPAAFVIFAKWGLGGDLYIPGEYLYRARKTLRRRRGANSRRNFSRAFVQPASRRPPAAHHHDGHGQPPPAGLPPLGRPPAGSSTLSRASDPPRRAGQHRRRRPAPLRRKTWAETPGRAGAVILGPRPASCLRHHHHRRPPAAAARPACPTASRAGPGPACPPPPPPHHRRRRPAGGRSSRPRARAVVSRPPSRARRRDQGTARAKKAVRVAEPRDRSRDVVFFSPEKAGNFSRGGVKNDGLFVAVAEYFNDELITQGNRHPAWVKPDCPRSVNDKGKPSKPGGSLLYFDPFFDPLENYPRLYAIF